MKKLVFIILGLCLLICITSKSQSVCLSLNPSLKNKLDEEFQIVGIQHNYILDKIYNTVSNLRVNIYSKEAFITQFKIALENSLKNSYYLKIYDTLKIRILCVNTYNQILDTNNITDSLRVEQYNDSLITNSGLSENLILLLNQLLSYSNDQNYSLSKFYHHSIV